MKKIKIKNKKGEKLVGILEKNKNTNELIITCHGSGSDKDSKLQKFISNSFKKQYNTFRFDFSGYGESEGKLEDSTYTKNLNDLLTIIDFFIAKKYSIRAVIGYSKSGTTILLGAKQLSNKKVKTLVSLAPRTILKNATEYTSFKKPTKILKNTNKIISTKYINNLLKWSDTRKHYKPLIKTIIIHGTKDKTININESKLFVKKFKKTKLIRLTNADHGFSNKRKELKKELIKIL